MTQEEIKQARLRSKGAESITLPIEKWVEILDELETAKSKDNK